MIAEIHPLFVFLGTFTAVGLVAWGAIRAGEAGQPSLYPDGTCYLCRRGKCLPSSTCEVCGTEQPDFPRP